MAPEGGAARKSRRGETVGMNRIETAATKVIKIFLREASPKLQIRKTNTRWAHDAHSFQVTVAPR